MEGGSFFSSPEYGGDGSSFSPREDSDSEDKSSFSSWRVDEGGRLFSSCVGGRSESSFSSCVGGLEGEPLGGNGIFV